MKTSTILIGLGLGYYLLNKDKVNAWFQKDDQGPGYQGNGNGLPGYQGPVTGDTTTMPQQGDMPQQGGMPGYQGPMVVTGDTTTMPLQGDMPHYRGMLQLTVQQGDMPGNDGNVGPPRNGGANGSHIKQGGGGIDRYPAGMGSLPNGYTLLINGQETNLSSLPVTDQMTIQDMVDAGEMIFPLYSISGKKIVEIVREVF